MTPRHAECHTRHVRPRRALRADSVARGRGCARGGGRAGGARVSAGVVGNVWGCAPPRAARLTRSRARGPRNRESGPGRVAPRGGGRWALIACVGALRDRRARDQHRQHYFEDAARGQAAECAPLPLPRGGVWGRKPLAVWLAAKCLPAGHSISSGVTYKISAMSVCDRGANTRAACV